MSTASRVPETWELGGDDARTTLRMTGRARLLRDAFVRLRAADGFSHARSLAFTTSLVLVQGIVALVGFASALGERGLGLVIVRTLRDAMPGPVGRVVTDAAQQAHRAGASNRWLAIGFGLLGALVTGTTMLGQFERGLNRLYGIEQDRPTRQKYGLAFALTLTSGMLATVAFLALAAGDSIGDSIESSTLTDVWRIARWPITVVLSVVAFTLLFRYSPRRRQPHGSWLAFGAGVATLLWFLATALFALFFEVGTSFGDAYGPLAGVVALLLWSFCSAAAILYGGAVAAQLEAVRSGVPEPRDEHKVEESEPDLPPHLVPSS